MTINSYFLKKRIVQTNFKNKDILNEILFLNEDISQILNNEELAIQSEHSFVNPNKLVYTTKNDSVYLKDIVIKRGKLVFYYSDQYCDICYKNLLKHINNYIIFSGTKNIIVIAEYENLRNFYYFLKDNKIYAKIYLTNKGLEFPAQIGKQPFFFMLDESFKAKYVYVPHKKSGLSKISKIE
jgi:hypothetical protein